jgi:hypothetical protein
MIPLLAGCSGSSSSGSTPQSSAEASANARASSLGISPIPGLSAGGHGPNGDITTPVSNSPSKTSPGGSVVFPNVSGKEADRVYNHLLKMPGVRSVPYYPQFDQLQVYFDKGATAADRTAVHDYVVQHIPDAAGTTTSASPTATASPNASAS